jgi:hypothetical protein
MASGQPTHRVDSTHVAKATGVVLLSRSSSWLFFKALLTQVFEDFIFAQQAPACPASTVVH